MTSGFLVSSVSYVRVALKHDTMTLSADAQHAVSSRAIYKTVTQLVYNKKFSTPKFNSKETERITVMSDVSAALKPLKVKL